MEEVDIDSKHPYSYPTDSRNKSPKTMISSGMHGRETRAVSIHSGVGKLTGGGVTKTYGNYLSIKDYKHKLDHRLGVVLLACLTTITTILFIYGLYYEKVQSSIVEYIQLLDDHIERQSTTTTTTTSIPPLPELLLTTPMVVVVEVSQRVPPPPLLNSESEHEAEDRISKEMANGANMQLDVQSNNRRRKSEEKEGETISTIVLDADKTVINSLTTSLPASTTETAQEISGNELSEYSDCLHSVHIAVWVLAALNMMALIFLLPILCLFHSGYFEAGTPFKAVYRAVLLLFLFFLLAQLLYLFDPLLSSSIRFSHIVDRLFVDGVPRPVELLELMEQTFVCAFAFHDVLVQYKMQEPCVPKIKDYLLPSYTSVLLIFIDLFPFLFIIFTYLWDARIKEWGVVRWARHRVELNQQKRPQSREKIVSHTLSTGQSSAPY